MSFPHLVLIFVIALVVLGPEKMPRLVAQVGRWVGKARSMARQFREQLENEINLEELNRTASKPAPQPTTPAPDTLYPAPAEPAAAESVAAEPVAAEPVAPEPIPAGPATAVQAPAEHAPAADTPAAAGHEVAAAAPEPAPWTADVHDHRLSPAAPPEVQSATPLIGTHERGA